jgi:poly-gamma-glutamate capsule biosynthesis protein CapA/YwtB (metallophosphatase superfamily)
VYTKRWSHLRTGAELGSSGLKSVIFGFRNFGQQIATALEQEQEQVSSRAGKRGAGYAAALVSLVADSHCACRSGLY